MTRDRRTALLLLAALLGSAGCIGPQDQRPGLWLSGEPTPFPDDWRSSDAHREVALEVATPYLVPHSVTIWCAQVDGTLYLAARNPDEKRWPGWVARDPEVRLRVGDALYEARLVRVEGEGEIARVRAAQVAKYDLDPGPAAYPMRYWRVAPR